MKVTFEIEDNLLKAAAAILTFSDPSEYDKIEKYTEMTEDVSITKEQLKSLITKYDDYKQLPLLISIMAIVARILEDEETD